MSTSPIRRRLQDEADAEADDAAAEDGAAEDDAAADDSGASDVETEPLLKL